MKKRERKEGAQRGLDEALADYDFNKAIDTDKLELLGIENQKAVPGIMNLEQMARSLKVMKMTIFSGSTRNDNRTRILLTPFNTVQIYSGTRCKSPA